MTTQQLIDNFRAYDVVARDTSTTLAVRIAADKMATENEKMLLIAAVLGDPVAKAFFAERGGPTRIGAFDYTENADGSVTREDWRLHELPEKMKDPGQRLKDLMAAHVAECDERCHSCTACYQRTGDTRCDKNCPHTTLEDFDE